MVSPTRDRVDDGLNHRSYVGPETLYDLIGSSQFSLLTVLGLREQHTLLDIGSGSFRGGKLFIPYLASGNYYAIEPNTWLIDEGIAKEIGQAQIALKRPVLSHDADFTLTTFGRTFDFLLAHGIFSHASQRQIARCLSQARLVMEPHSVFAATFNVWRPETGQEENYTDDAWSYPGTVSYTLERMTELAAEHGLRCRQIAWPQADGQTWIMLTRPEWQGTIPSIVDLAVSDSASAPPVPDPDPAPPIPPRQSHAPDPSSDDGSEPLAQSAPTASTHPRRAIAMRAPADVATSDPDLRILVGGVGVRYRAPADPSRSLKEYVIRRLKGRAGEQEFWALNDVSLTIRRGEVVGIVGRNGAGKSTLLKTISRVLRPTVGRLVVRGRVTPLLELGAGFHPEQTGRENVYLNSTLLGHSRREVDAALPTIVEFSGLQAFLDAPVRTYSTGMVGRLGFAIATAWSPDILILDEILGVGDSAFQEKCALRIAEMREHASTVLLVSHSMDSIRMMCQRVIWIDHGNVKADGPTETVIAQYLGE